MSLEKLYFACLYTNPNSQKYALETDYLVLESFWLKPRLEKILSTNPEVKFLLDSGAFSADSFGIDDVGKYLNDYISFIRKYENNLLGYFNLDNIRDAEISWKNQKYIEERGLTPIPAYHYGEDFKWLETYCNEHKYVGIGGVARGVSKQNNRILFDKIFEYVDKKNLNTKFHAFGITSLRFLLDYPWYSADSTTWLKFAAYGKILMPKYDVKKQEFVYTMSPTILSVSNISIVKESSTRQHYSIEHSPEAVKRIENYFDLIETDPRKLQTSFLERAKVNILYFDQFYRKRLYHQKEMRNTKKTRTFF
jgi:hypothetical protein